MNQSNPSWNALTRKPSPPVYENGAAEKKRHIPASESLLSETLELLGEPLWSFPALDDELLPSLKNEGKMELGTTLAGKTQSANVKIRVHLWKYTRHLKKKNCLNLTQQNLE